ncbi:RNA polymerase sigma-70 factor [Phytoactinopolyspora limicola]|uniref:RNA polymerase sigma-70 factor n=1 Tax=Phytoactinopolyspora limicola TaxID=2715536 RepID=UPI001407F818|nr:RNA polymerase sigma-70 factor [Phytoactinopolyspora limicola]
MAALEDFQAHRPMLFGIAYRMLGSVAEAEDAVQDTYLRWLSADRTAVREPRRYLSRIATRLAIDRLRVRVEREVYVGQWLPEPVPTAESSLFDPLDTVMKRASLAMATLHLMERLDPVERAVFVLREGFELSYAEIAETVERSPDHCRQLYRRASKHLERDRPRFSPGRREHARLLERLLDAARHGDLPGLREVLHHDVVIWSDGGGKVTAARNPVVGADRVSRFIAGIYSRPQQEMDVTLVELNGAPGAVVRLTSQTHAVAFAVGDGLISGIFVVSNPDKLTAIPEPR